MPASAAVVVVVAACGCQKRCTLRRRPRGVQPPCIMTDKEMAGQVWQVAGDPLFGPRTQRRHPALHARPRVRRLRPHPCLLVDRQPSLGQAAWWQLPRPLPLRMPVCMQPQVVVIAMHGLETFPPQLRRHLLRHTHTFQFSITTRPHRHRHYMWWRVATAEAPHCRRLV